MPMREMVVVLKAFSEAATAAAAGCIRARFKVLAALPPRVLIVQPATPEDLAALLTAEGVADVAAGPEVLNPTPPMNDGEQLFVAGWVARGVKSGPPTGEGREGVSPEWRSV